MSKKAIKKHRCFPWADLMVCISILILVILCAGDPDLLDAIIKNIGGYK